MEARGREILGRTIDENHVSFRYFADMRYVKQGFEVRVQTSGDVVRLADAEGLKREFEEAYRAVYGHVMADNPVEVVSWRVVAHGPNPKLALPRANIGDPADPSAAVKGRRGIWLPGEKSLVETPIYDRYALPAGAVLAGPAVIEERESTVVVSGTGTIRVDEHSNLVVDLPGSGD